MQRSAWIAGDGATPPGVRASQLRRAWERFVADGRLEAIRKPIADSWQRSSAAGVDPSAPRVAPALADAGETSSHWQAHPLSAAAPMIRQCLGSVAADAAQLLVVSDGDGMLLWIEGPPNVRLDAAESMNFIEGAGWSEAGAGTNAIGTALAADHAVQVFAAEHFNEAVQQWTCTAAPVHDPDTGRLLGSIDLTGKLSAPDPCLFGCAVATARAVEHLLRTRMHERDERLRARYEDRIAGDGRRASLVTPSGRVISGDGSVSWIGAPRVAVPSGGGELTLPSGLRAVADPVGREEAFVVREAGRASALPPKLTLALLGRDDPLAELDGRPLQISRIRAEILALLAARPRGMASDELAAALYGDDGQPGAVRVQIFRLRQLIGPWIYSAPYRLRLDVETDVAEVHRLLERGAVREAAERYDGPLLPSSDAPGIVREREALEGWLRQAVMTADDAEALWAWAGTASGREDLAAWKRLLANLDYTDPRRSLAASRLSVLRAQHGVLDRRTA
jgi:hypothetical protein